MPRPIKLLVRRSYGFRNLQNMFAYVKQICSKVQIPLPNRPLLSHRYPRRASFFSAKNLQILSGFARSRQFASGTSQIPAPVQRKHCFCFRQLGGYNPATLWGVAQPVRVQRFLMKLRRRPRTSTCLSVVSWRRAQILPSAKR